MTVAVAEDCDVSTVTSHEYANVPGALALVVSTLVLVGELRLMVLMVTPAPAVRLVEPVRHTNCFAEVTFAGTVAVHTILNVLCGATSSTITAVGWTCTKSPNAV